METKSPWPLALKYALVLAFSHIAITLLFYLINPSANDGQWSLLGVVQMVVLVAVSIYVLYIAARARRDQDLGGSITYGQSLGFMTITAIPAVLIISLYTYIFFAFIAPEAIVKILDAQAEQFAKQGKSDEEIEQMLTYTRMFTTPLWMSVFGGLMTMVQLVIFGLIASIFSKKEPKTFE